MTDQPKESPCSLEITLPESLRELVEEAIAEGRYGSASEYIQALIAADRERGSGNAIEDRLIEFLESAEPAALEKVVSALRAALARREGDRARQNLLESLGLMPVGLELGRQRLRAQFPAASEEEIERRLRELLTGGEGATPWFRPVSTDRLRRLAPE